MPTAGGDLAYALRIDRRRRSNQWSCRMHEEHEPADYVSHPFGARNGERNRASRSAPEPVGPSSYANWKVDAV